MEELKVDDLLYGQIRHRDDVTIFKVVRLTNTQAVLESKDYYHSIKIGRTFLINMRNEKYYTVIGSEPIKSVSPYNDEVKERLEKERVAIEAEKKQTYWIKNGLLCLDYSDKRTLYNLINSTDNNGEEIKELLKKTLN